MSAPTLDALAVVLAKVEKLLIAQLLNRPGPLWLVGIDLSYQKLFDVNLRNANLA
jgi:hypothetical protein